jgi:type VI secretion system ImpA family protein
MSPSDRFNYSALTLLSPISAKSPSGESLRYEGTYDKIMEARREEDALEQGVWKRDLKKADWNLANRLCLEALQNRSKDLQIAAWLLESWIHLRGFPGVRAGCEVLVDLCRTFWDSMYPSLDDPEYRLAPLHWIDEKLSTQLKFIPITSPETADTCLTYTLADWETAFHREQSKHQSLAKDSQTVTMEMIHQSAWLTPTAFFEGLIEDVGDAFKFCKELEGIFDHAFGKDSCSLGQFRSVLESILTLIPSVAGDREAEGETQAEDGATYEYALEPVMSHETVAIPLLPPIRSRAEAYRRLAEVADYLIRTEPHSPAPYLIRRAISWGGMTLEQLLPELVASDAALKDLERLLKIETAVKTNAARK